MYLLVTLLVRVLVAAQEDWRREPPGELSAECPT